MGLVRMLVTARSNLFRHLRRKFYQSKVQQILLYPIAFFLFCLFLLIIQLAVQEPLEEDQTVGCKLPKMELWPPSLRQYFKDTEPLVCANERNWVYVENSTFKISKSAQETHGHIECEYTPYEFETDFSIKYRSSTSPMKDGAPVETDFFVVDCKGSDGKSYHNVHSTVFHDKKVRDRATSKKLPKSALGLNILILGYDSLSRMTFMRTLPLTYKYLTDTLGAIVLEGFNIGKNEM